VEHVQRLKMPITDLAGLTAGTVAGLSMAQRVRAVDLLQQLYNNLFSSMAESMRLCQSVAARPNLPMSVYVSAHKRLIRVAKLDLLLRPWPSSASLASYLDLLRAFYRSRMPNIEHFITVEQHDLPSITTKYPLMAAVHDFEAVRTRLAAAAG